MYVYPCFVLPNEQIWTNIYAQICWHSLDIMITKREASYLFIPFIITIIIIIVMKWMFGSKQIIVLNLIEIYFFLIYKMQTFMWVKMIIVIILNNNSINISNNFYRNNFTPRNNHNNRITNIFVISNSIINITNIIGVSFCFAITYVRCACLCSLVYKTYQIR